jgi:hypothetical protein
MNAALSYGTLKRKLLAPYPELGLPRVLTNTNKPCC